MKQKLMALFVIIFLAGGAVSYDWWSAPKFEPVVQTQTLQEYKPLPDFAFQTLEGKQHEIRMLEEEVVLLNFWASWCVSCIVEFPALLQLVEEYEGRVALVAVSIDDNKKAMESFLDKRLRDKEPRRMDLPHVYWVWDGDKSISLKGFNVTRVPETIVVDPERLMVGKVVGEYDWTGEDIRAQIEAIRRK